MRLVEKERQRRLARAVGTPAAAAAPSKAELHTRSQAADAAMAALLEEEQSKKVIGVLAYCHFIVCVRVDVHTCFVHIIEHGAIFYWS